jgi:predicted ribonuclease YlaK
MTPSDDASTASKTLLGLIQAIPADQTAVIVDGVPIRNGKSRLVSWPSEPDLQQSLSWPSPQSADDRLIASSLEVARAYARSPLAIVTRDINLQNKCEQARIVCLEPPSRSET